MKTRRWLPTAFLFLLLTNCSAALGQKEERVFTQLLTNRDVVRMVQDRVPSEKIIGRVLTSSCNFDVFPPVLRDLRRRGVPDTVLAAMKLAPVGPPALADVDSKISQLSARAQIPAGT